MTRQIIKNNVIEILSSGARITLASVKKNGFRSRGDCDWKLVMHGLTDSGAPKYEFASTRREAIERLRFVYNITE